MRLGVVKKTRRPPPPPLARDEHHVIIWSHGPSLAHGPNLGWAQTWAGANLGSQSPLESIVLLGNGFQVKEIEPHVIAGPTKLGPWSLYGLWTLWALALIWALALMCPVTLVCMVH